MKQAFVILAAMQTIVLTAYTQEKRSVVVQGRRIIVERDFKKILENSDDMVSPQDSTYYLKKSAPTLRPWWEPDDSMKTVNEKVGSRTLFPDEMIRFMGWGLLGKEYNLLASNKEWCKNGVSGILEALYRGGFDCQITNILHQALLAPTNHYRDATFHAYVMASPVPMTLLAETVVKGFPAEQRKAWYSEARRLSFEPEKDARYIDRPSREALRFAHFLHTVKPLETDPECLRIIGNPVDPKRAGAQ